MKHGLWIVFALGLAQSAFGQAADINARALYDRGDVIVATVPNVPLSDAAVELRNPIAPQSNFTARTIEDDRVFAAQVVLRKNGCYDGRLDGVLAEGTIYAIKLFEANMGLVPTGELTRETETALRQSHARFDICR
nr:peptidoglycan-binding domain-containing protein [Hyphomonas sp. Mor2]